MAEKDTMGGYNEYCQLENLFRFGYLQDDRAIHNFRGHNRTLKTIMFLAFDRSNVFKIERTFLKLMDC